MSKLLYKPHPQQMQFMESSAKYRLFGGARGGGKSHTMRMELMRMVTSVKGLRILVLRRTFPEIYQNMVIPLQQELPTDAYKYNEQKSTMTFNNESSIKFGYCRNLKDVMQYQGVEFDVICIEELTHWQEMEFKLLMGSLRTTKKNWTPCFIASCNPGSIGHAWVKRLWIDRKFEKNEKPEEFEFIASRVYDNPTLLERDPDYVARLEALPEAKRRAWLDGDWDAYEGQVFTEWRKDIHVIKNQLPKGNKRTIICLDYGYNAPSAVYWIAERNDGHVIVYRELYVTQHTYHQLATKIKALTTEKERIDYIVVDPAIVGKRNEATGTTGGDEFKRANLYPIGADNERIKGLGIVHEFMKTYVDPNTNKETSRLQVTENCVNLIRTIPQQIYDEKKIDDVDTRGEDHAYDALRYGLVSLYAGGGKAKTAKKLNQDFHRDGDNILSLNF